MILKLGLAFKHKSAKKPAHKSFIFMSENPLHQFEIHSMSQPLFQIGGYDVGITNSAIVMLIGLISVIAFLTLGMRKQATVPGRWQSMSEMSYNFVANMIGDNIGPEGKKFFPLIFTLFMFVLFANLLGMFSFIPGGYAVTSQIAVTFALAILVFLTVTIYGLVKHGFHFFSLFAPSGVPLWIMPFIVPIELVSFLARPISLSIRLAAAMTAGHVLLEVIAGFIVTFIASLGVVYGIGAGALPLGMLVLLIGLEIFICFLQAYIFALLTSIYLHDAVHLH